MELKHSSSDATMVESLLSEEAISLSTLFQTGCFPQPVEPIIKGLVFQKLTSNSQSKKILAIFAKVGDVTRQLYNAQNPDTSLPCAPMGSGGGGV